MLKTIVGWFVLWILVLIGVLTPFGYLAIRMGQLYLNQTAPAARNQAVDMIRIIASQVEGVPGPERLVSLSQTMSELVQRTNAEGSDTMAVSELALIDPKGRVLAHSDVTKIARDTISPYATPETLAMFNRLRRDAVGIKVTDEITPELPPNPVANYVRDRIIPKAKELYPDLFVRSYQVTCTIYPIDGEVPSAGFILKVDHRAPARIFRLLGTALSPAILIALASVFGVVILYLPVLIIVSAKKKQKAPVHHDDHIESMAVPEEDVHASEQHVSPVDFDDIPLPDFLEDAPITPASALATSASRSGSHYDGLDILDAIPIEPDGH